MTTAGTHPSASSEQWLIRTASNDLYGPFDKEQLLEMIQEGRLKSKDEVCRANHYWFALDDAREVRAQLGIAALRLESSLDEEEITETETHVAAVPAEPEPEGSFLPKEVDAAPEILKNRALRQVQAGVGSPSAAAASSAPKPIERLKPAEPSNQRVERTSVWAGLASFLIVAFVVLIYLVIRTLRKG